MGKEGKVKSGITPTTNEKRMRENDFIVSKTDIRGRITYGNEIFIEFSGGHGSERHPSGS